MKRLIHCASFLIIALAFGASLVEAQTQNAQAKNASNDVTTIGEFKLTDLLARIRRPRQPVFSLMSSSGAANITVPTAGISTMAQPVEGSGQVGYIARWSGVEGSNTFLLGTSSIFQEKFGKIGIGTTTPTSPLTVLGLIETKGAGGGVKFPDGTVQTTAGVAPNDVVRSLNTIKGDLMLVGGTNITVSSAGNTVSVAAPNVLTKVVHDASLTGEGTPASPLSVAQAGSGAATMPVHFELTDSNLTFTVPAGKRLVIEFISGALVVEESPNLPAIRNFEISLTLGSVSLHHEILANKTFLSVTSRTYEFSQLVRLYADPGTEVTLIPPLDFINNGRVAMAGYYVNVP